MRKAVIFGVTGQDGSYLAELLLTKGYYVVGVARRTSTGNEKNIKHLKEKENFLVVHGDVTDPYCVYRLLGEHWPDEIYNLAAQSHVRVSFDEPSHTWDVTAKGCLNILEWLRNQASRFVPCGYNPSRFYQASSSEMFGSSIDSDGYQRETTHLLPCSPYAIAKVAAHQAVRVYREAYGVFACSGILYNHESPRRGESFVSRKITKFVADLMDDGPGKEKKLFLGNLSARRDWGYAPDYVEGMWLMLQQSAPDDYVLATGESHTVEEFLDAALEVVGVSKEKKENFLKVDPSLYRPCEVPYLRGDASKAKKILGWKPTTSFNELVSMMVWADVGEAKRQWYACFR